MRLRAIVAAAVLPAGISGLIAFRAQTEPSPHALAQTAGVAANVVEEQASGPSRRVLPGIVRDGFFPEVNVSSASAFQGGAVQVTVANAQSGSVAAFGRTYQLSPDGSGGLIGIVAVAIGDRPGNTTMAINLVDQIGDVRFYSRNLLVKSTTWTVDSFTVPPPPPPDPNAPPPPPPPPDDNPLLPGVYAGLTEKKWTPGWVLPFAEPNLAPCNGGPPANIACVSGYFGEERVINGIPQTGHHGGTDIGAYAGTPILATNSGVVVMSGLYLVRGNLVVIDHGSGIFSLYGHMSNRAVAVGESVAKGQVVGYVGSTGFSSGPHLHWELSVSGVLVDGLRWLDGTQGF